MAEGPLRRRDLLRAGGIAGVAALAGCGQADLGGDDPEGPYQGPLLSAHEHFSPAGKLGRERFEWFVEWMDGVGMSAVLAFLHREQLPLVEPRAKRIIAFDNGPFNDYLLARLFDPEYEGPTIFDPEGGPPEGWRIPETPPGVGDFADRFRANLEASELWAGIGEIGLSIVIEDGEPAMADDDWLMDVYAVAGAHDVSVAVTPPRSPQFDFHPWDGDPLEHPIVRGYERAFEAFPDVHFLVHGFPPSRLDWVDALLDRHDNWTYDVSGIMNAHRDSPRFYRGPMRDPEARRGHRESFAAHMTDAHVADHVDAVFPLWAPLLRAHPDRILWGIDAGLTWQFHEAALDPWIEFYRRVLGRLPPEAARKIAHDNAAELWL